MSHPIIALQAALVAALREALEIPVFDAPPKGAVPPYLAIARHDVVPRDGDLAPGHEHRLLLHIWAGEPSRRAALELAETVLAVALALVGEEILITHRLHERTETAIDGATGQARAALAVRFYSEPI